MLEIQTAHKMFQIKSPILSDIKLWHLRLQEVIMLQEKVRYMPLAGRPRPRSRLARLLPGSPACDAPVRSHAPLPLPPPLPTMATQVANVAHGWLLKEEFASAESGAKAGDKSQLKHYWFVLFSNGILMYFSDPNRAVLGQVLIPPPLLTSSPPHFPPSSPSTCCYPPVALRRVLIPPSPPRPNQALGFIPVESCTESSHSAKQHTLLVKCAFAFASWLLAPPSSSQPCHVLIPPLHSSAGAPSIRGCSRPTTRRTCSSGPRRCTPRMVNAASLAAPYLATTGSSDRVRRLEAALGTREERPSVSDPTGRP